VKSRPSYYIYLISSLPTLHFGTSSPFSFERFLEVCKGLIPDSDIDEIKEAVKVSGRVLPRMTQAMKKWHAFDATLRNELVKVRASRKKIDQARYLRPDGYEVDLSIAHIALTARRNPSIIEAEKTLDQERWRTLDEIAAGHYFDLDTLIVYAHKLLILEKWDKVQSADKAKVLEEALA